MQVRVVPHNPQWQKLFEVESKRIIEALEENIVAIHHIGSTAIPGIYAKPIVDLLGEVKSLPELDDQRSYMEALGYEVIGEFGIPGRRYFRKNNTESIRTYHVHIFEMGSEQVSRHLAFRDYMIAHPTDAQRYSELKRRLAQKHPTDIEAYMGGKDGFIKAIDQAAMQWRWQKLGS